MISSVYKRISVALLMAVLCVSPLAQARKVTTRIKAPVYNQEEAEKALWTYPRDETRFQGVNDNLTFIAYDKKGSADRETFFVDNRSSVALHAIQVEISYFNNEGKLIHKREVEIRQEIPPGETRKVDIASWDRQKSFHYVNSVPSKKGSTPYTVRFRIISFLSD